MSVKMSSITLFPCTGSQIALTNVVHKSMSGRCLSLQVQCFGPRTRLKPEFLGTNARHPWVGGILRDSRSGRQNQSSHIESPQAARVTIYAHKQSPVATKLALKRQRSTKIDTKCHFKNPQIFTFLDTSMVTERPSCNGAGRNTF